MIQILIQRQSILTIINSEYIVTQNKYTYKRNDMKNSLNNIHFHFRPP
jgi:hypothetical protein